VLTLLLIGLLALFSVWSLEGAHARLDVDLAEHLAASNDGRSAQVAYKTEVQEWKNVLLRGANKADKVRYWTALGESYATVNERLKSLQSRLDKLKLPQQAQVAGAVLLDSVALNERYVQAYATIGDGPFDPAVVDAVVRGADRPLNVAMDSLAGMLIDQYRAVQQRAREAQADRYAILVRAIWVGMLAGLLLVLALLWRVLGSGIGRNE
jgi:hypothetical protein